MAKRKEPSTETARNGSAEDSGSDDDMDMVDVDFEWFDLEPEVDFHGLKTLLRQLFDVDNQLFDLSELVDLILSQRKLGSTVKVDGKESDPFAFLTVLNVQQHKERQVIKDLASYLSSKAASIPSLAALGELLVSSSSTQVGLIFTERLINMPAEIVPPLYNFILEEMRQAVQENEPYNFTHYLVLSKTYTLVDSSLDAEDDRPSKKKKQSAGEKERLYFHPEDEVLHRHALGFGSFEYTNQGDEGASDSKRAFQEAGIKTEGHVVLIEAGKFEAAVKAMGEYLGTPAG